MRGFLPVQTSKQCKVIYLGLYGAGEEMPVDSLIQIYPTCSKYATC